MQNTRPLRTALVANAIFSITCSLFMLFVPSYMSELLGTNAPLIIQLMGISLILFAIDLIHQATRKRPSTWRVLYSSAADFLWVLGSLALIVFFSDSLSFTGLIIVLCVATIVLFFGILQIRAINQAHRGSSKGMYRHCIRVNVPVKVELMWNVLRRMGDIADYTPSLKSSKIMEGKSTGIGVVRCCVDKMGRSWSEKCVEFNEGSSFVVKFLTNEPGFPFPASEMTGGWEVSDANNGADVTVWWELNPKPKFLAPLIIPILAYQADRNFPKVIENMANDLNNANKEKSFHRHAAKLLPIIC